MKEPYHGYNGGKTGGPKGGRNSSKIVRTCPDCGRVIKGGIYFYHIKKCKSKHECKTEVQVQLPNDLWNPDTVRNLLANIPTLDQAVASIKEFQAGHAATWYVYELLNEANEVVYVGITTKPNQRLYQHTKKKPHKTSPTVTYGLFYGQNIIMNCVAGFDTKGQALVAETLLKKENGLVCSEHDSLVNNCSRKGGQRCAKSPNFVFKQHYKTEDGHITTSGWLKRYCAKRNLDPNKAIKV